MSEKQWDFILALPCSFLKVPKLNLDELPFIRLGGKIDFHGKDFNELITEGQREIDISTLQPNLEVNLKERTVKINSHTIEMTPVQLMLYTSFLRQKLEHCKHPLREYFLECIDCFSLLLDFSSRHGLEKMAEDYKKIYWQQPLKAKDLKAKWRMA